MQYGVFLPKRVFGRIWSIEKEYKIEAGVYISVQKQYLFPPPSSENVIFLPLMTCHFLTPIVAFQPYFFPQYLLPPPLFWKCYFSPSHDMSFFDSYRGLSALILPYFAFILPFYFPFSFFLSPFFLFIPPFYLFLLHFPSFSLPLFIFFAQNDIGWYFPPPSKGEVFSNI